MNRMIFSIKICMVNKTYQFYLKEIEKKKFSEHSAKIVFIHLFFALFYSFLQQIKLHKTYTDF